jgi:acetolactate synthase-1/2/3 large subunit
MRGCEFVVELLYSLGIDTYFAVTGGAIVPLLDSVGRHPNASLYAFQHEQAAAMACEGYWRETGRVAVVAVTSGPGIQNTLNGVCGAWYDSVPMLIISGQVNSSESLDVISSRPRQRGFQEMPVVSAFSHFCVYAQKLEQINDKTGRDLYDFFTKAVNAATTARFGPALVDLPVNIQMTDVGHLPDSTTSIKLLKSNDPDPFLEIQVKQVLAKLCLSRCPVVVFGAGIRSSDSVQLARRMIDIIKAPFTLSWGAKDLFPDDHSLNCGCHGVYGSRAANLTLQNSDCLLILGSRLDTRQTGGNLSYFAPTATKIHVDIDQHEIGKLVEKGLAIDLPIVANLHDFLTVLIKHTETEYPVCKDNQEIWTGQVNTWKDKYSSALIDQTEKYAVQPHGPGMCAYTFFEQLDAKLPQRCSILADTGANLCWVYQVLTAKADRRFYTNLGNSSMGFSLPASIGSAIATKMGNMIVSIQGDGGVMMNIQELKTVIDYKLPIKIFVINNSGYGIIKQFQDLYFEGRYLGTEFPGTDFVAIANAFGMHAVRITRNDNVETLLDEVFKYDGPVLVDVIIQEVQKTFPKLLFGNALEHMSPFISMEELEDTMRVPIMPRKEATGWVKV